MSVIEQVKRIEKAIEAEPNQFLRWKMRRVLADTIKKMEVGK